MASFAGSVANPAEYGKQVAQRLCLIVLPYEIGTAAAFDLAGFNGRPLADDVMDVMITLSANKPLADGVAPDRSRMRSEFPYFGERFSKDEQVGVVPVHAHLRSSRYTKMFGELCFNAVRFMVGQKIIALSNPDICINSILSDVYGVTTSGFTRTSGPSRVAILDRVCLLSFLRTRSLYFQQLPASFWSLCCFLRVGFVCFQLLPASFLKTPGVGVCGEVGLPCFRSRTG